jgi:hypothetical protein
MLNTRYVMYKRKEFPPHSGATLNNATKQNRMIGIPNLPGIA